MNRVIFLCSPRRACVLASPVLVAALLCSAMAMAPARAQSEASAAVSLLPVASVVGAASVVSAAGRVPVALSVSGAVLMIKGVDTSAAGTLYLLERASDGAQVSVQVVARGVGASAHAAGTVLTCSVIGTGVVLSVAGEAITFLPNALGQALLHNERL